MAQNSVFLGVSPFFGPTHNPTGFARWTTRTPPPGCVSGCPKSFQQILSLMWQVPKRTCSVYVHAVVTCALTLNPQVVTFCTPLCDPGAPDHILITLNRPNWDFEKSGTFALLGKGTSQLRVKFYIDRLRTLFCCCFFGILAGCQLRTSS